MQEALAEWLVKAEKAGKRKKKKKVPKEPDLSFLAPDDPIQARAGFSAPSPGL